MISPVSFGAGPSTAPARPTPEEVAQRLERALKSARLSAGIGDSRVRISPEGALRAQADAQTPVQQRQPQQDEAVASATPPPPAPAPAPAANAAPQSAASPGRSTVAAELSAATNLAFDAADRNRDGTVTVSEQQTFEFRTVRISAPQPSDGRPGPAGSGPIRAYLEVDATIAGI